MKRGKKNITHDLINRQYYIKYELKKILLKSIIRNQNVTPKIRSYAIFKLTNLTTKSRITRQINFCLIRGRSKGVWKFMQFSRHVINKLAISGNLQNTKISSW